MIIGEKKLSQAPDVGGSSNARGPSLIQGFKGGPEEYFFKDFVNDLSSYIRDTKDISFQRSKKHEKYIVLALALKNNLQLVPVALYFLSIKNEGHIGLIEDNFVCPYDINSDIETKKRFSLWGLRLANPEPITPS